MRAIGRVVRDGGSRAQVEGEILLPDGTVSAKCTSILFKIPEAVKAKWGPEADEWNRTSPTPADVAACGCTCETGKDKNEESAK